MLLPCSHCYIVIVSQCSLTLHNNILILFYLRYWTEGFILLCLSPKYPLILSCFKNQNTNIYIFSVKHVFRVRMTVICTGFLHCFQNNVTNLRQRELIIYRKRCIAAERSNFKKTYLYFGWYNLLFSTASDGFTCQYNLWWSCPLFNKWLGFDGYRLVIPFFIIIFS